MFFKQVLAKRMRAWRQINYFLNLIKWAKHARLPPLQSGQPFSFTIIYISQNLSLCKWESSGCKWYSFSFWGWFLQFANLILQRFWCHRSRLPRFCAFMIKGNIRDGPWWDLNGLDVVDEIFLNFPDIHSAEISIFDDEVVILKKHTFLNGFLGSTKVSKLHGLGILPLLHCLIGPQIRD